MSSAKGAKYKSKIFDAKALKMKHDLNIPDKEATEWEEAFLVLDKDHSGKIDATEVIYVFRALGHDLTLKEVEDMIREDDVSGDGEIDFAEFLRLMWKNHVKNIDYRTNLREAFRVFDRNGSGTIDKDELRTILTTLGDEPVSKEEARQLIAMADTDGDGEIDFEEFSKMMTTPSSP